MTYNEVIKRMNNLVNRHVKHYKTDFEIDKEILARKDATAYRWIIRESGTHLIAIPGKDDQEALEKASDYIGAIKSTWSNYKDYLITFNKDHTEATIKLISNTL